MEKAKKSASSLFAILIRAPFLRFACDVLGFRKQPPSGNQVGAGLQLSQGCKHFRMSEFMHFAQVRLFPDRPILVFVKPVVCSESVQPIFHIVCNVHFIHTNHAPPEATEQLRELLTH